MHSIEKLLKDMISGVMDGDDRYNVMTDTHVLDTLLDVNYHLEPKDFKIVRGDKVLTGKDSSVQEGMLMKKLKDTLHKHYEHRRKAEIEEFKSELHQLSMEYGYDNEAHGYVTDDKPAESDKKPTNDGYA